MYKFFKEAAVAVLDRTVSTDAYATLLGRAPELADGVVCASHEPAVVFKVELILRKGFAKRAVADVPERCLRAIAAAIPCRTPPVRCASIESSTRRCLC